MTQVGIASQKIFVNNAVVVPIHATTPQDLVTIDPGWVRIEYGGVVELMGMDLGGMVGQLGPREGLPFAQVDVASALGTLVHGHVGLEDTAHGGEFIPPTQRPTEIHKAAALGIGRTTPLDEVPHRPAHGRISGQFTHAVFGETAADEEAIHLWQTQIVHGTKGNQLRPRGAQGLEVIGVIKAERCV